MALPGMALPDMDLRDMALPDIALHATPYRRGLWAPDSSYQIGGNNSSLSFAGSIIGHDDPTLVHTNVDKKQQRNDEVIKPVNSEALDSFLTVTFSEEERRDAAEDERRPNQSLSEHELRQELVELDRAQDTWREKHGLGSDDMDDTGDFYVKEVGEFTPTSPRRKRPYFLNEETIYEEVTERGEPQEEEAAKRTGPNSNDGDPSKKNGGSEVETYEPFDIQFHDGVLERREDGIRSDMQFHSESQLQRKPESSPDIQSHSIIQQLREYEARRNIEFHDDIQQQRKPEVVADATGNQSQQPKIEMVGKVKSPRTQSPRIQNVPEGVLESVPDTAHDTPHDTVHDTPHDTAHDTAHDTGLDTAHDTANENVPDMVPDSTPDAFPITVAATVAAAVAAAFPDTSPDTAPSTAPNAVPETSQEQHPLTDGIDTSYDQSPHEQKRGLSMSTVTRDETNEYRTQQAVATSVPHEPHGQETAMEQNQEEISDKHDRYKVDSALRAHVDRFARSQSEESELDFEYPSTDEHSDISHRTESSTTYVDDSVSRDKATIRSFLTVEDNVDFSNTEKSAKTTDTDKIIRAVQERLYDFSSDNYTAVPYATVHHELPGSQENDKHRLFAAGGSPMSKMNGWRKTQALASKVDRSKDEDDVDVNSSSNPRKNRRKLCMINICCVFLLIAAIICATFLTLQLRRPREKNSSPPIETGYIPKTTSPTPNPTQSTVTLNNTLTDRMSPADSESSTLFPTDAPSFFPTYTPSRSPVDTPSRSPTDTPSRSPTDTPSRSPTDTPSRSPTDTPSRSPTDTPSRSPTRTPSRSPTHTPSVNTLRPTPYLSSKEETILKISGDSVFNTSSPQHAAYDWILTQDPVNSDSDSSTEQEVTQRYIAVLFYFAMNGYDWIDQYGFLDESHVCGWNNGSARNKMGIICNDLDQITGFVINENNLRGQLPSELVELTDLTLFRLRGNNVYGTLPSRFGRMSMLEEIDLRQNKLIGTVSESIFSLPHIKRILLLRNSQLSGTIPATIEKASSLEMLSFQRCQISGRIPSTIGNLSNLFFLTFMDNLLTGSIPESLTNLSHLEVLELSGNQLTGSIPDFVDQNSLYFVSLFDNKLTGSMPSTLGALPSLMFLDIRNNELGGSVPSEVGLLPDLVTFFAENNRLTGTLPSFVGNKGLLQAINLSNNKLSGHLENFFGSEGPFERLVSMDLAENNFVGSIPSTIGMFTALSELNLGGNSITGSIPKEIGSLLEMITLDLQSNDLSGTLPEELGLAEQLLYLNVANNRFEGTIPDTLVMLSKLTVLDLNSNELVGSIPTIFGQLSNLDELWLNNNNLVGDLTDAFCQSPNSDPEESMLVETLAADCLEPNPVVACSCCTVCCKGDNCINNA
eukprot:CAMPEP_0172362330 /NCGR_PEP_ID=MMETSP1060-20121228/5961_1 /TAXON_ID=37318 /ORGANISM="Pseudo-nitzschia pungens, Strain cf. cingulata" /LENGTH=1378 /DNA_ID=CAMNT_0013084815 /DNA_START=167 /DNA_END=4302 /DNA_ORIENTATION=-